MTPDRKTYKARYQKTPERKAAQKRYRTSPEGKAYYQQWKLSPEGKAYYQQWKLSPEGKVALAQAVARYRKSPKGKANRARGNAKRRTNFKLVMICDLTNIQWAEILHAHKFLCHYCHQAKNLTMDHVVPLSKGGQHTASNIVPACQSCNSRKGANLWIKT